MEAHGHRKDSIGLAFSEWEGQAEVGMQDLYKEDCSAFEDAYLDLQRYRDSWVNEWIDAVDDYNREVRTREVQVLQNDLLNYYAYMAQQEGHLPGSDIAHNVADEFLELFTFGHVNIRKDEAEPLVPQPRGVRDGNGIPSPPHYHVTPVFVRYVRYNYANPTAGMYDIYSEMPG